MRNESEINIKYEEAKQELTALSQFVLDSLKPPSGAYAFFHFSSNALTRLADCQRIVTRLFHEVRALANLSRKLDGIESFHKISPGQPFPEEVQTIVHEQAEINSYAQLDLESLYMFGVTLLDQWSLQALCIGNLQTKRKHPFDELVHSLEFDKGLVLQPLWSKLKVKILWLYYQIKFYRNRFIVHANTPLQRGTNRSVYGEEFKLHTPTPPGWLDEEKLDNEIRKILYLAPEYIQRAKDDYWEKSRPGALIESIFDNIGNIDNKKDQDKAVELFSKKGGMTPSFHAIGYNLFEFIAEGAAALSRATLFPMAGPN